MLETRLLGTIEIRNGKKPLRIPSRPSQSLFAYLILSAGTAHRREKLAGLLWPDSLEETARDNLRHSLWRVRKALPVSSRADYILADDLTIAFNSSADYWLDVDELRELREDAPADQLIAVLSAYNGELLPGFYDEWVLLERQHLYSIFEGRITRLMSLLEGEQRWHEVLHWGERWISLGQHPEPAYRALMSAHATQGDVSSVVATYERCAKYLRGLGLEPSPQTQELYKALGSGRVLQSSSGSAMAAVTPASVRSLIPVPLTSFVGREQEIAEIIKLLRERRLVTLTGSGGVGKTRLAMEVARRVEKRFRDGARWVGLVGLSDPDLIPQEIAQTLQVREVPSEPLLETVKRHLRTRDVLLILDNCEHLIRASAECAEQLLSACPKLKLLTTSIEALGLFNESSWRVPSLPLPEPRRVTTLTELEGYASIQLFFERAANSKPGFALNEHNAAVVAKICEQLDGIPLAIELAAARIKVLTVGEIAARLDDRFSLLTSGSRTAIPRHQTLRATIDWSHELLSETEKILFRRLGVFPSGFTLGGIETICATGDLGSSDIFDTLGRLVDKSLVIAEGDAEAGETRYRVLETIRQYALEKLVSAGEARGIRQKHAEYFLHFADEAEPQVYGSEAPKWVRRLHSELDNVRAAIEWFTANEQADRALQMLGDLVYFWFAHGLIGSEWNDRLHDAMACPEGRERTLARAKALNGTSFMYWADIAPAEQRSELEEALSIAREFGDPWNSAVALRSLGLFESINGHYASARDYLRQSVDLFQTLGTSGETGKAFSLNFLGDVAFNEGELLEARSLFEEAALVLRNAGDMNFLAYAVRRLGQLDCLTGDFRRAKMRCAESLGLNQKVGDPRGVMACTAGFAAIAVAQSKYERAAVLMGAVQAQLAEMKMNLLLIDRVEFERNRETLRQAMPEKVFQKCWAKGQAMSMDAARGLALEES